MNKIKVFVLPHLGASAINYISFKKYQNEIVELFPIEYTGRGRREKEPYYKNFEDAVEDIKKQIELNIDNGQGFCIFGHSMGALLALEVAKRFEQEENQYLQKIFLSGCSSPDNNGSKSSVRFRDDQEFIGWLYKLGGLPKEMAQYPELLKAYIGIIRQDIVIYDEYRSKDIETKVHKQLVILYAIEDPLCQKHIKTWIHYTDKNVKTYTFTGGHFYIFDSVKEIVQIMESELLGE